MSMRVVYIGEALAAAGFSVAGARVHAPVAEASAVWELVTREREHCDLLILNQDHADTVASRLRELIHAQPAPPVMVIPAMSKADAMLPDIALEARQTLGLA